MVKVKGLKILFFLKMHIFFLELQIPAESDGVISDIECRLETLPNGVI